MSTSNLVTPPEPAADLEALAVQLTDLDGARRAEAARLLRDYGPDALDPLCRALADRDPDVRLVAAESLGRLADERAIGPLTEALRRCFIGGSARRQLLWGIVIAAVLLTVIGGYLWGAIAFKIGGAFGSLTSPIIQLTLRGVNRRRAQSRLCVAITEALDRIAARHPSPRLREVLPELRALALDVVQQDGSARKATREAAQRIDELTARLKDLPLASSPPAASPNTLPVPAEAESTVRSSG